MFVRTKDNRIIEVEDEKHLCSDNECRFQYKGSPALIKESNVVKSSDNLEDLFDCRVDVDSFHHIKDFKKEEYTDEDKRIAFDNARKYLLDSIAKKYVNIYGAIWTSKGLIYVARMNDKGEWELC